MKIFITNLGKYCEGHLVGKWVQLPISDDKLGEVLKEIGIDEYYEETFISDCENDIIGLNEVVSEYSSISVLNKLAQRLEELSADDARKLGAVLEYEACTSVEEVLAILDKLDEFELVIGVSDDETLGYYYAEELCSIEIPEHLKNYMDYEAYGRDIRLESSCLYTSFGFLLDNR
jgi:antirestriction protein